MGKIIGSIVGLLGLVVLSLILFLKDEKQKTEFAGSAFFYDSETHRFALLTDLNRKENILVFSMSERSDYLEEMGTYLKENASIIQSGSFSVERFDQYYTGSPEHSGKSGHAYITFEKPLKENEMRRGFSANARFDSMIWLAGDEFESMKSEFEYNLSVPVAGHALTYKVRSIGKYHSGP